MMPDKLNRQEQDLVDVQGSIKRIFESADGKLLMQFLEIMTGYDEFSSIDRLQQSEGSRRIVIFMHKAIKWKSDKFLKWCKSWGLLKITI